MFPCWVSWNWVWSCLLDINWVNGFGGGCPCVLPESHNSHAVGFLLLVHTQSGSYSYQQKKWNIKLFFFFYLCCVGRTQKQMAREHNVLRLETEKFRSPQIEVSPENQVMQARHFVEHNIEAQSYLSYHLG